MKQSTNLSIRLKLLRKEKGIGQKELAAYLHVSVGTVSNYENGVHSPDVDTLIRIADYYDVSMDCLLGRTACSDKSIVPNPVQDRSYILKILLQFLYFLSHESNSHLKDAFQDFEYKYPNYLGDAENTETLFEM